MKPAISFFCPAYHDEKNLPILIPEVHAFLSDVCSTFEIIIIEDGSPDRTDKVANELARRYSNIRVIHHLHNLGYGAALQTGFRESRLTWVMYTDGDRQYDVNELRPYLDRLSSHDVLSGYAREKALTWMRRFQSEVYNRLIRTIFSLKIRDVNCSMKIYHRSVLESFQIQSTSSFIDAEMLIKAKKNGFTIFQFPVTHYPRISGRAGGSKPSVIIDTLKDIFNYGSRLL